MGVKEDPDLFSEYISVMDKAEYHARSKNFPKGADYYQAYIHIGFFLGFLAEQDLLRENVISKKKMQQFLERDLRPGELAKLLGGKVDPLDMTNEGKKFTYFYYAGDNKEGDIVGLSDTIYLMEYLEVLRAEVDAAGDPYLITDDWNNYEKIKQRIGQRYEAWIVAGSPAPRYREFKSLDSSSTEKIKTYLRNKLASGLISKTYPEVTVEEPSFRSYMIKIDGHGQNDLSKRFYSAEEQIRKYLKLFTDRHVYFKLNK